MTEASLDRNNVLERYSSATRRPRCCDLCEIIFRAPHAIDDLRNSLVDLRTGLAAARGSEKEPAAEPVNGAAAAEPVAEPVSLGICLLLVDILVPRTSTVTTPDKKQIDQNYEAVGAARKPYGWEMGK